MSRRKRREWHAGAGQRGSPDAAPGGAASARPGDGVVLGILLALYLILGGLYLATVPFGNAPDEGAHYLYVQELARGRLPVLRQGERTAFEAHQPPLAYALAVPAYVVAGGLSDPSSVRPKVAVRAVNLVLGGLIVFLVFSGMRLWLPDRLPAAVGAAAVTALLPMRLATASSFSNDPLTEVLVTAALVVLALGLRDGFGLRRSLGLGALIGLGVLTKSTAALLVPAALLALFLAWRRGASPRWEVARGMVAVLGTAALVAGPWLARNVVLYGDPLALGAFERFFQKDRVTADQMMAAFGLTFGAYLREWVLPYTARSFWGVFDHMNLWMGGPAPAGGAGGEQALRGSPGAAIYTVLQWIGGAVAAGAGVAAVRWWREGPAAWQREAALLWGMWLLLVGAAFLRFNLAYFQAQARYLFPAVLPVSAAVAGGWLAPWPRRWQGVGAAALVVALTALALYAWYGTLLRFFGRVGW